MKVSRPCLAGDLVQPLHGVLRLDDAALAGVLREAQAVLAAPRPSICCHHAASAPACRWRVASCSHASIRRQQRHPASPTMGHFHRHVLVDRGRVDIDVDLPRARAERVEPPGHAVVEPGADVEQHVAAVHRQVRLVRAVHPQHAEELRIVRRIGAEAHQRVGAGKPGQPHEARQRGRRPGIDDAAAGVHHRPLRADFISATAFAILRRIRMRRCGR